MPKRGTKVEDLARELGITSRELIDRGRAEGIDIQNRITKLTLEQAQRMRACIAPGASDTEQSPTSD